MEAELIKQRTDRELRLECIKIAANYVTQGKFDASKVSVVSVAKQLYTWINEQADV